jgi:hypothetical protein
MHGRGRQQRRKDENIVVCSKSQPALIGAMFGVGIGGAIGWIIHQIRKTETEPAANWWHSLTAGAAIGGVIGGGLGAVTSTCRGVEGLPAEHVFIDPSVRFRIVPGG